MRYRIRHWFARFLCARGVHLFERRASWSRCVRVHWFPSQVDGLKGWSDQYLCYVKEVKVAYDHGKGRIWLR